MTNSLISPKTERLPDWIRRPGGHDQQTQEVKRILRQFRLTTVCEEARCPNIAECFGRRTATFMILGDTCTRNCSFCSVRTGFPVFTQTDFEQEVTEISEAVSVLGLTHVVITSVTRDDLIDGGASQFASIIRHLRESTMDRPAGPVTVEVLIPDFQGDVQALEKVLEAKPDVLNHNLETVSRLYRKVRPQARYQRSLDVLRHAKLYGQKLTKTGIMLGLGENELEVKQLMDDVRAAEVDIFTAGQYMRPTLEHLPVAEYLAPERFSRYRQMARDCGFKFAAIGPLVRSSYNAEQVMAAS